MAAAKALPNQSIGHGHGDRTGCRRCAARHQRQLSTDLNAANLIEASANASNSDPTVRAKPPPCDRDHAAFDYLLDRGRGDASMTDVGYVLRRIMRRAMRQRASSRSEKTRWMHRLYRKLCAQMGGAYPRIGGQAPSLITETLLLERNRFKADADRAKAWKDGN